MQTLMDLHPKKEEHVPLKQTELHRLKNRGKKG